MADNIIKLAALQDAGELSAARKTHSRSFTPNDMSSIPVMWLRGRAGSCMMARVGSSTPRCMRLTGPRDLPGIRGGVHQAGRRDAAKTVVPSYSLLGPIAVSLQPSSNGTGTFAAGHRRRGRHDPRRGL